ncbi:DUF5615 family PIN-like protein [Candidatus Pacearchaeota archaeon]|nr:DUF5615 family PIN-like protein [Candidatus Pacearchaeota archaeon]
MRFLADENISNSLIKAIKNLGHDIKDIKEYKKNLSDLEIVKIAYKEDRIILTHDKDFANLKNYPLVSHKGVILLRFSDQSPINVTEIFIKLLNSSIKDKFKNSLVIINEEEVRIINE